jgi:tetratricopeptide (TPR) repeat protein
MGTDNTNPETLQPVCFMIMPYGIKPTFAEAGKPATINYDLLWEKTFLPLIEKDLGYQAIRADQDLGAMIIKEMIERLALSDLVIAEISTPNANVYYEIGIRHAAKAAGCVLISADWSKQNFDLNQIRQLRYPLPEGAISDETGSAARESLKKNVAAMITGTSPVFECIPGFPGNVDTTRVASFRKQVDELAKFSTEVRSIRLLPVEQRLAPTKQLVEKYRRLSAILPVISMELIYLLKDNTHWELVVEFIDTLPESIKSMPIVQEQRCLAQSKNGKHLQAISALEELIRRFGDSSERQGLIGGRYKKLFKETNDKDYLNKSIAAYDRGMRLDLNDYFPSCNLARLYRTRKREGDEERAKTAATVTVLACERARKLNPADEWLLPTLLAAAFDAGNLAKAQELYNEMSGAGIQPFKLDSVVGDLETGIALQEDASRATELRSLLEEIKKLK